MSKMRIVIADVSSTVNQHLKTFLEERGFQVLMANDGDEAMRMILTYRPQLALVELMLQKQNALSILKNIKASSAGKKESTKVVILSNQSNVHNIKECIKWGAVDFLLKPLEVEDIVSRIVFHLQPSRTETRTSDKSDVSNLYLHLVELVLQQITQGTNLQDIFRKLTQMTAMALKSVRASIIKCEPHRLGLVKASSDDLRGNEWNLDLRKYPEILYVINTGKTLVVENLDNDPTLNQVKQYFSNITFNSMIVVPIYHAPEHFYGVLVIRMPNNRNIILDEELRFSQIISQCLSLAIKLHQHSTIEQAT